MRALAHSPAYHSLSNHTAAHARTFKQANCFYFFCFIALQIRKQQTSKKCSKIAFVKFSSFTDKNGERSNASLATSNARCAFIRLISVDIVVQLGKRAAVYNHDNRRIRSRIFFIAAAASRIYE